MKALGMRFALAVAAGGALAAWATNAEAICVGKKRKAASRKNKEAAEKFCKQYVADNPGVSCKVDKRICPKGYVAQKKWKGCGINYSACVKGKKTTRLKKRREQGRDEARQWCESYTKTSGEACRYVKTGAVCPKGFRHYTKVKHRGMRNYKICVRGKKVGGDRKKVTNNCDPKIAGMMTRALNWLDTNFDEVAGDFEMAKRRGKDRRKRRKLGTKLRKAKVACYPRNTGVCKKDKLLGMAKWGQTRKVHICSGRIDSFCDLVGVLFHELAHRAKLPKSKIHNSDDPRRVNDHVYRIGFKARDACVADGKDMKI